VGVGGTTAAVRAKFPASPPNIFKDFRSQALNVTAATYLMLSRGRMLGLQPADEQAMLRVGGGIDEAGKINDL
jgi:hypothetical protein